MNVPRTLLIARPRSDWSRQLSLQLGPAHGLPLTWTSPTIPAALQSLGTEVPDIVIVLQETPDQFSAGSIQQLLTAWPLARLVVCHGPWCNGDARNRDAWPLAATVPHTCVENRLASEQRLGNGMGNALPWTAGRDEIAAADFATTLSPPPADFTFQIVSPDTAWGCTIADQLVALGGIASAEPAADLLLIDVDPWDRRRRQRVAELLASTNPRTALLLSNSPASIPPSGITSIIEEMSHQVRLELHDKLAAAARPATLATSITASPARRSA